MRTSLLVKVFGFSATLFHGDCLVFDRWLWIRKHLPVTRNGETLLDIGCGSGAFTIGAARRGYSALGLSWDAANQMVAAERASICGVTTAKFEVWDVRCLGERDDLRISSDVAICCENIEHVLDDRLLMLSMANCLKPGGRLLLTAPNLEYRAITSEDNGPFPLEETGWHVRRGYTQSMLCELVELCGLKVEEISYCSGFLSQKITWLQRVLGKVDPLLGWFAILPLRPLPVLFDGLIDKLFSWPAYSICLVAYKPRFPSTPKA